MKEIALIPAELPTPDPWDANCPSRDLIAVVSDKWVLLLLPLLKTGAKRNSELMRQIGGISQRMLTQTLRTLEENGLVTRRDYGEMPPKVDYQLTALGESLCGILCLTDQWVVENFYVVRAAQQSRRISG